MNRQEQIELLRKEISERQKKLRELQNASIKCGFVEYDNCGSYGNIHVRTLNNVGGFAKDRRTRIATVRDDCKIEIIDGLIKDFTDLKNKLSHADS